MKKRPAKRSSPPRSARRWWLLGGGAATIAVAAAAIVLASPPRTAVAREVRQFTHIHGLAVPAWAEVDVFVSTHSGLARIDVEGRWTEVGGAKHDFMGFHANPTAPGVLYSSGHPEAGSNLPNPIGFLVSHDAGASWEPRALTGRADFHAMAVQESNGDVIYGFNGAFEPGLYRSLDAGRTWERRPSDPLLQLGGAYALAVHPERPDSFLAGTGAGLLASDDGGATWQALVLEGVPVTAVAFAPGNARDVLAYGVHPDAGLVRSVNGGASWEAAGFLLEGGDAVGYIALDARAPERIYLGSFGMSLYRSDDGGATWEALALNGVPR